MIIIDESNELGEMKKEINQYKSLFPFVNDNVLLCLSKKKRQVAFMSNLYKKVGLCI